MLNTKSYPKIIIVLLKERKDNALSEEEAWLRGVELDRTQTKWGWIGPSAQRRARELAKAGIIESRMRNGFIEYRYKPPLELPREQVEKELLMNALL